MDIYNDTELRSILTTHVIYPMVEFLSKKIQERVRGFLAERKTISTRTMQEDIVTQIEKKQNSCIATIYVDTQLMQTEQQVAAYGQFSKFISLDMSTEYMGQSISYYLVKWLEETGAHGSLGNNPIEPIGMFKNVYNELDRMVPKWISDYATVKGIRIERR